MVEKGGPEIKKITKDPDHLTLECRQGNALTLRGPKQIDAISNDFLQIYVSMLTL